MGLPHQASLVSETNGNPAKQSRTQVGQWAWHFNRLNNCGMYCVTNAGCVHRGGYVCPARAPSPCDPGGFRDGSGQGDEEGLTTEHVAQEAVEVGLSWPILHRQLPTYIALLCSKAGLPWNISFVQHSQRHLSRVIRSLLSALPVPSHVGCRLFGGVCMHCLPNLTYHHLTHS